jgi:hypothetical protein
MTESNETKGMLLGLLGAALGGLIGYCAFFWIAQQGFYALVLPGGLLGLGAGFWVRSRSIPLAIICGFLALALGLFAEWRIAPFVKDGSLAYFLAHAYQLKPITLIMILAGAFLGFWVPYRSGPRIRRD